jgi:RNA polymerase sigma-70 factor (ECF subfamily)
VAVWSEQSDAELLYREHFDFVWRNARRLGASDAWVDDAVHEVFLVATRRLDEFEGRAKPRTWLFAITLRVVQRMRRDRARYDARLRRFSEQPASSLHAPYEREDAARHLRQLLLRLDEPKRVVLILAELEGMTTPEIADALGVKAGTVDSRLRAARLLLMKLIARERTQDERRIR